MHSNGHMIFTYLFYDRLTCMTVSDIYL